MTIERLLIGLIGIPLGFCFIYFRVQIKDFIGNIGWAEKYLGMGGTWLAIVVIGILITVGSFLWMLGVIQDWFVAYFGGIFGSSQSPDL